MSVFQNVPFGERSALVWLAVGADLEDALEQFGVVQDCIGCSTTAAAPAWTSAGSIDRVLSTFYPESSHDPIVRPDPGAQGLLRRCNHWTEVDIDAGAQRLRTVRMPAALVGAQRLLAVSDLRGAPEARPIVAIGLWALFAHPVVRVGARVAGARDGLTAEIALAVHPERYVLIDRDREAGLTFVIATTDPIVAELLILAMRQNRLRNRPAGPWEDPLIQAASELELGARNSSTIDIEAFISPTLSGEKRELAEARVADAAVLIGVEFAD